MKDNSVLLVLVLLNASPKGIFRSHVNLMIRNWILFFLSAPDKTAVNIEMLFLIQEIKRNFDPYDKLT